MGSQTLKIVLSVLGAGIGAFCAFLLLEAIPFGGSRHGAVALLFRFQLSALLAMALFAGLAIVLYARLSRRPTRKGTERF